MFCACVCNYFLFWEEGPGADQTCQGSVSTSAFGNGTTFVLLSRSVTFQGHSCALECSSRQPRSRTSRLTRLRPESGKQDREGLGTDEARRPSSLTLGPAFSAGEEPALTWALTKLLLQQRRWNRLPWKERASLSPRGAVCTPSVPLATPRGGLGGKWATGWACSAGLRSEETQGRHKGEECETKQERLPGGGFSDGEKEAGAKTSVRGEQKARQGDHRGHGQWQGQGGP